MAEGKRIKGKLHSILSLHLLLLLSLLYPWLAVTQTRLTFLPGFPGPLPFHLETGYVGVGDLEEDQLFYYFVESQSNPKQDPLVLWLTGGPGCSGWSGLVYEVGPLHFETADFNGSLPTLGLNPHSWTQASNIIFVDAPVGTGFSFSRNPNFQTGGDFKSSRQVHEFLRKWLNDHPQFLSNPLYIGGDSYAGTIIPIVVQEISNGIEGGQKPLLNLKGYFAGNPRTDYKYDGDALVPYLHGMGIISDKLFESANTKCNGDYRNPRVGECANALQEVFERIMGLNTAHILEPLCFFAALKLDGTVEDMGRAEGNPNGRSLEDGTRDLLSQSLWASECRAFGYLHSYFWANNESVRKALNIQKGSRKEWRRCNFHLNYTKEVKSVVHYHYNLTTKGYRALIYSGDHDAYISHVGTQAWIRSLNFSIVDQWRSWSLGGQIAGYTRSYANNLTFATIKGAGHTAPEYKPREAFAMFQRWISHQPL